MQEIAIRLDEERRREFKRFLKISGALHAAVFLVLAWQPAIPSVSPPTAITVDLVAAPSPGPQARPKPKPKPPKPAPVVLPSQPTTPKPRAKPVEKPPPKPKPKPEPETEPKEVEYDDLMAQLRAEAGEEAPQEKPDEPAQTATATAGGGGGLGVRVSPELAAWLRDARIHVRRSWVVPPAFEMQTLVVEVQVDLDASGNVRGTPNISRRSGNPWYDENVVRSIRKASPLPPPPEAGTWTFVFYSDRDA